MEAQKASVRTESVTATMQVSIGMDDEAREEIHDCNTEREHVENLAENHVCDYETLRSPQSVAISETEERGDTTVYHVTVHIMESR